MIFDCHVHGPAEDGTFWQWHPVTKDAEDMIRYLAYWAGSEMITQAETGGAEKTVSISESWKEARQLALKTFSLALAQAASMSIEHVPYEPSKSERF